MSTEAVAAHAASPVEAIKRASRGLRGTLVESLADPVTGALRDPDTHVLKFHGTYQQDDRDTRETRRVRKLEPAYSFMLRARLPGGALTPAQWIALDDVAGRYANGTLRLTTRQAVQLHGVVKRALKPTLAKINAAMVDTLGACGDVNRNVIASAVPAQPALYTDVQAQAAAISSHLLPKTRAYHEIWLDESPSGAIEEEPVYGTTFLPRKFKIAIAVPPYNDVDVFAHDLGYVAIVEHGAIVGYDVTVGGGLGATHGDPTTYPRLADVLGHVPPERVVAIAEAVAALQRDEGERGDRKHARFKYTVERLGLARVREEVERRAGFALAPARGFTFEHNGDRFGWLDAGGGAGHYTLRVPAGRVADVDGVQFRSGVLAVARGAFGTFRITPNQNLVIANVTAARRDALEALLTAHGLVRTQSATARAALACVALPTCPLAMAEAERYLPAFVARVEALQETHGIGDTAIRIRITGCPNGCARPNLAEIGLIGKAPGRYNLHLGADVAGQRLNVRYRENVDETQIVAALDPLFARYAGERRKVEPFGDWLWRAGVLGAEGRQ